MKTGLKNLFSFPQISDENPELLKAQYHAFCRQMPMMYFILISSTWALAITHMPSAPVLLTTIIPCIFSAFSIARITVWWKSRRAEPTTAKAFAAMKRANRLAILLSVTFTLWSFLLYPYGDPFQKSHVAFYMAITVISVIFCLLHLRSAALIVTAVVNGTFIIFFTLTGQPTFIAIAVNILLVCFGMLVVLTINYDDFERMVLAQQKTEALSNENLRLANMDSLTFLPNRRAFFHRLETAYAAAKEQKSRLAVGIVDLDGFKPVNDLYGHSAGDRLLLEVGQRLESLSKAQNLFLARLGGDEFAFIISEDVEEERLVAEGNRICARLRAPFITSDATIMISGSIGIAVFPDMAATPEELFDHADYALYQGKRGKRGTATLFTSHHVDEIHRDARVEQALKQADLTEEMSVLFQPIVDIHSGKSVGFEALARWNSALLGSVSPAQFIPIAERAGFISMLTRPLLKKALTIAQHWPNDLRLAFNLSAQDINSAEATIAIIAIIENSGFPASRLDLEITETAFIHDARQARTSVDMLRQIGCGISLDDFGTGYSSLTSLHCLPLTKLKIDRSFVSGIDKSAASYNIVRSVLTLSREMGLDAIVEGVETQAELDAIGSLGACLAQGYLFSPPIPAKAIPAFLQETTRVSLRSA